MDTGAIGKLQSRDGSSIQATFLIVFLDIVWVTSVGFTAGRQGRLRQLSVSATPNSAVWRGPPIARSRDDLDRPLAHGQVRALVEIDVSRLRRLDH